MSKTDTFHVISGLYRDFPNFVFLTDFDASKNVLRSFFAFFAKIWPINIYRSSKSRFFCLPFFTWWPEMTLTCIMVTKHRKWYLQMSVTLSMPIHWLCLRLTSKFYSPMWPSPKSRKFWLWPDLLGWSVLQLFSKTFDFRSVSGALFVADFKYDQQN